jgi:tRNA G26 N,N-dimethylase Trm1
MAETITIPVEFPKELINRIKAVKPLWLSELSDEQFLSHVIAHGDFGAYLAQIEKANEQVQNLTAELHLGKTGPAFSKRLKNVRRDNSPPVTPPGQKPSIPS